MLAEVKATTIEIKEEVISVLRYSGNWVGESARVRWRGFYG
jgi:hypothetical protein